MSLEKLQTIRRVEAKLKKLQDTTTKKPMPNAGVGNTGSVMFYRKMLLKYVVELQLNRL